MRTVAVMFLALLAPLPAGAINVFSCEPEWGSLVRELAGELAELTIATTAFQDPHRLEAKPSLIAAIRKADLVVCTGADLEIGWLPLLLRRAGNAAIQSGGPGHFMAADYVRKLETPKIIDRSQGDIHPQGNPHVHLDPRNIRRIADALAQRLAEIDPMNAAAYGARLADFQSRWDTASAEWEGRKTGLVGLRLASHHRSFSYLAAWLDLNIVATLESKPGIPPSGAQLAALLEQLSPNPPVAVIRTPYENEKPSSWLSARLGIPAITLPYTTGSDQMVTDLFALFEETLRSLEDVRQ
ncbi:MAG: zinc ABC transporter substrate-binding protein [Gammaproteobacteria bacterium]|nr:zinc ABC transporter substrate-binding protein [Gammaproteobacteria bacterium]